MRLIEKIEIKHFRSFDGGKNTDKVQIIELKDLNVFSGANDSGKSNVLRALNLFFNGEVSPGVKFNPDRDFSKIVLDKFLSDANERRKKEKDQAEMEKRQPKEVRKSDENVSIKLYFLNPQSERKLPTSFWVSKTFSRQNVDGKVDYSSTITSGKNFQVQISHYLNSLQFEYVPAIKDREFFSYLFGRLQEYLFENSENTGKKFKDLSKKMNDLLKTETSDIFTNFKNSTSIDASFNVPETLMSFYTTLRVNTERNISLFDRGDGVQARFIPEILNEISKSDKRRKRKVLWAFEEPENSYEYKNAIKLASDFANVYSIDKQLFITTHSFNFLALSGESISTYRVFKDGTGTSLISRPIDIKNPQLQITLSGKSERENLEEELGVFELSNELNTKAAEYFQKIENVKKIETQLLDTIRQGTTPIIITEGKTDIKHLKAAKRKLCIDDVELNYFEAPNDWGDSELKKLLEQVSKLDNQRKIIGIFDRDVPAIIKEIEKNGQTIRTYGNNVYAFCIPIPDSRRDYNNISIEFYYSDLELKTLKDGKCLYFDNEIDNLYNKSTGKTEIRKLEEKRTGKYESDKKIFCQDIGSENWIHSKERFAEFIETDEAFCQDFSFENFHLIFNKIKEITTCNPPSTESPTS